MSVARPEAPIHYSPAVAIAASGEPPRRRGRPRLSDDAATHVRELIIAGRLKPGQFIRSETIADELGISATPAREGLLILQSEGFVQGVPRRGFVVSPLSRKDIEDTFAAQALLAGELAARAATLLSDEDLDRLEQLHAQLESMADRDDLEQVEALNFEIHRTIYRGAQAPKIHWLLAATLVYAPRRFYAAIEGWPDSTIHEHHGILRALRERAPEPAREAMMAHVHTAGRLLMEHLSSTNRTAL